MDNNSSPPPPPRVGSEEFQRQNGTVSPQATVQMRSIKSSFVPSMPLDGSRVQATPASVTDIGNSVPISSRFKHIAPQTVYRSLAVVQQQSASHFQQNVTHKAIQQQSQGKVPIRISQSPKVVQVAPTNSEPPFCLFEVSDTSCDVVSKSSKETIGQVNNVLTEIEVDYTFRDAKFKWKCVSYSENRTLSFRVFMFLGKKQGMYTLELQKRQGCAFHFSSLYNAFKHRLAKLNVLCEATGEPIGAPQQAPRAIMALAPPPLPSDIADCMSKSVDASCLTPLIEMSQSKYTDVQKEGVRELANQADKEHVREVLGEIPQVFNLLGNLCSSSDEDIVRCAAATVSGLAKSPKFHRTIVQHGILNRLTTIAMDSKTSFSLETRRICMVTVAQLHNGECKDDVFQTAGPQFFDMFQTVSKSDRRVQAFARQAQVMLNVH